MKVEQSYKAPPVLVARREKQSRAIWDPNPQLKDIQLADVSIYKWKDTEGREWEGGLHKPANFQPGDAIL